MTCFMETTLFSPTPVIIQCVHEPSGHRDRDGSYIGTQQYGLLLNKTDLATATSEFPNY